MIKQYLRWKKNPVETGLYSIAVNSSKRGSKLHDGLRDYAMVECLGYHYTRRTDGWYWVAYEDVPYMNTCKSPVGTEAEAKAAAMAYVKQHLAAVDKGKT